MARPRKATQETSEVMATEPSGNASNGAARPSKKEMVRQAMLAGKKKPADIQQWIKDRYNETLTTQHISTNKSNLRKGKRRGRKPAAEATSDTAPAPRRRGNADSLSVEEIRLVKGLVDRIGSDKFKAVVELLS